MAWDPERSASSAKYCMADSICCRARLSGTRLPLASVVMTLDWKGMPVPTT